MPKLSLQAEEELKAAWSQQAEQLQEMGRRERLLQSDVQRAGEQVGMGTSPWGRGQHRDAASRGEDVLWEQKPRVLSTKPWHRTYLVTG